MGDLFHPNLVPPKLRFEWTIAFVYVVTVTIFRTGRRKAAVFRLEKQIAKLEGTDGHLDGLILSAPATLCKFYIHLLN